VIDCHSSDPKILIDRPFEHKFIHPFVFQPDIAYNWTYPIKVDTKYDMGNDWYEYVEYGTMSSWMINLQRIGFNRESATIILNQKKRFIDETRQCNEAPFMLNKAELLNCRDEGIKLETQDISINIPDLFF